MSQLRADAIVDADGTGAPEFTNGLSSQGTIKLDGNYPVGTRNVALGDTALDSLTSGNYNTAIGDIALTANTSGSINVAVGGAALTANTTGSENTALGYAALERNTTASYNTAVGRTSMPFNTTGANNTSVGFGSLYSNTTASNNTAVGYQAGYANTTGTRNTAVGKASFKLNTTGSNNTAVGIDALGNNSTGSSNTAVGDSSLNNITTGISNTAVGTGALVLNITANSSTALGWYAGGGAVCNNGANTFIGETAGYNATSGHNTFIGREAGYYVTSGEKNTILGKYSGNQGGLDIRTLSNRIVLSDGDGNPRHYVNASGDQAFSTVDMTTSNGSVGRVYAYEAPSNNLCNIYHLNTASHQVLFEARRNGRTHERMSQINIGENGSSQGEVTIFSSTANANLSGGVVVANGATSWSSASDTRLKTITGTYDNALQDIANIEPIKFTWKADSTNQPNVGVSAQSVQAVVPEAVDARKNLLTPDDETEYLSVKYTELIPLMIASIQELSAKNDALEARITALEA
jgi:hypothetical protein